MACGIAERLPNGTSPPNGGIDADSHYILQLFGHFVRECIRAGFQDLIFGALATALNEIAARLHIEIGKVQWPAA